MIILKPVSLEFTRLRDGDLYGFGVDVHTRLTGNSHFSALEPALEEGRTTIVAFQVAMAAAAAGGPEQTSLKNDARKALLLVLRSWATQVGLQALGNTSIILSSGFKGQKPRSSAGPLPAPRKVVLKATPIAGQVLVSSPRVANAAACEIHSAATPDTAAAAWTDHGSFTSFRVTLEAFTPGELRWVKMRALGAAGPRGLEHAGSRARNVVGFPGHDAPPRVVPLLLWMVMFRHRRGRTRPRGCGTEMPVRAAFQGDSGLSLRAPPRR